MIFIYSMIAQKIQDGIVDAKKNNGGDIRDIKRKKNSINQWKLMKNL